MSVVDCETRRGRHGHSSVHLLAPMSTLASAQFDSSDDEADADFVPTAAKPRGKRGAKRKAGSASGAGARAGASGSEGEGESSGSSGEEDEQVEEGEAKRLRLDQEAAEQKERRRKAREAFAAFGAPVPEAAQAPGGEHSGGEGGKGVVEVRRAGQFAGETI